MCAFGPNQPSDAAESPLCGLFASLVVSDLRLIATAGSPGRSPLRPIVRLKPGLRGKRPRRSWCLVRLKPDLRGKRPRRSWCLVRLKPDLRGEAT